MRGPPSADTRPARWVGEGRGGRGREEGGEGRREGKGGGRGREGREGEEGGEEYSKCKCKGMQTVL